VVASNKNFPLLAELLAEQQRLDTPVARFSATHDGTAAPALEPVYRDLIPLTAPRPGEHYAFEVELDACTGCKACVSACHSLNGLDETETWRDVGLLVGGDDRRPFQQTVTTACHHCADPACLNGCPVLAYEKDPATGIVRHLDDQCIGCQYCVLKCPYDVPKYNARLGIVRKCDLCHSRLAHGEAPACVQACPTQAIRIVTVPVATARNPSPRAPAAIVATRAPASSIPRALAPTGFPPATGLASMASPPTATGPVPPALRPATASALLHRITCRAILPAAARRADTSAFLATAPDPGYTQPTTRYLTRRAVPANLAPADIAALRPQPPHWPLALMLTLLPLAVGCLLLATLLQSNATGHSVTYYVTLYDPESRSPDAESVTYYVTLLGWVAGVLGLGASVGHLGRPLRAWRIFLGWRRSWLSREAMVFGAWFAAVTGALASPQLVAFAAALGLLGLFCSVMIYVDTRRVFWRFTQTAPRFFGGAVIFGAATALGFGVAPRPSALVLALATLAKLACELRGLRPAHDADDDSPPSPALTTARLLGGPLRTLFGLRLIAALVAGLLLPAMLVTGSLPAGVAWVVLVGVFPGELIDRHLFFRAVDAPKMPGMPP
jgi:Fe-S-cluster-containing dehydrogenase component/DMSO reductase anchor subunit